MVTTMGMECLGLSEVPYSLKTRWQGRLLIFVNGADSPSTGVLFFLGKVLIEWPKVPLPNYTPGNQIGAPQIPKCLED